jgi:hypothetical protein
MALERPTKGGISPVGVKVTGGKGVRAFGASKTLMNHIDFQTSGTLRSVHSSGSSFSQIACELLKKTEVREAAGGSGDQVGTGEVETRKKGLPPKPASASKPFIFMVHRVGLGPARWSYT